MLVIIVVGNIRKGVITFISWVVMIDRQSMVEEIVVIVIITFNCTELTPLGSGIFVGWIWRT
jgi:Na+/proline symporter